MLPWLVLSLWPVAACLGALAWWHLADLHPGMQPARGVLLWFALLALVAGWWLWRRPAVDPAAGAWWSRPWWWALAALAWQGLALSWAPVSEPGMLWLAERTAALAVALGLACVAGGNVRAVLALGMGGALLLIITCLGRISVPGDPPTQLGHLLQIGTDPPTGLPNFAIGAGVPLLAALAAAVASGPRWGAAAGCAGLLGVAATVVMALGVLSGDTARGGWIGLAAIVAATGLLAVERGRLAPRWALALVLALVAGAAAATALLAFDQRLVTAVLGDSPSSSQRAWIWSACCESLAGWAALVGHGPGATIAVLPQQPSFVGIYLAVPSWVEHAHHEPLQALMDGGLVNVLLLAGTVITTLLPLWRRRREPACRALLAAWVGFAALAGIEATWSQPGPVLALGLLAGVSWSCALTQPAAARPGRAWAGLAVVAAVALTISAAREPWYGGAPTSLVMRAGKAWEAALAAKDWTAYDQVTLQLHRRLGPLDDLAWREAEAAARRGDADLATACALDQLARLPIHASTITLLYRLGAYAERHDQPQRAKRIAEALEIAKPRIRHWLATVPANDKNRTLRERLEQVLAQL